MARRNLTLYLRAPPSLWLDTALDTAMNSDGRVALDWDHEQRAGTQSLLRRVREIDIVAHAAAFSISCRAGYARLANIFLSIARLTEHNRFRFQTEVG